MTWAYPQAFWLLLLVPLAFWPLRGKARGSSRLSGFQRTLALTSRHAVWGPRLLAVLRASALTLFIVALARPQSADAQTHTHSSGIAIQLVLDTSTSMGYTDYSLDGRTISRLDAARHAVRLFVKGSEQHGLPGRRNDVIGLVTFNRTPDVACPLTHSHDTLLAALDEVILGPYTNIGDGIAWSLDRLNRTEAKEKVLILLSDGKQNVKDALGPEEAARLAAELGIRIYCIGAVGNQQSTSGGLQIRRPAPADSIDEGILRRVAEMTGGRYYRATDTDGLLAIYKDIDKLETTRLERSETVDYDERFLIPLLAGLMALALEQLLGATRFLVVP